MNYPKFRDAGILFCFLAAWLGACLRVQAAAPGVVQAGPRGPLPVPTNLPLTTIQAFLDPFVKGGGAEKMDYVHGDDVLLRIGSKPGHVGIYLPAMEKTDLFKAVILDGALPRKTFSMGEARSKRFYMEARKIS